MHRWELVEGKDLPKELGSPYFKTVLGTSTMPLMLRMTKQLWVTGKAVNMESDFCVTRGMISIFERVVYGIEFSNKHIYCRTLTYVDGIIANCKKKVSMTDSQEIGRVYTLMNLL